MDIIEKNELKQAIKLEFDIIIKETMLSVLNKHNISHNISERIIKDFLVWSNMIVDMDLN